MLVSSFEQVSTPTQSAGDHSNLLPRTPRTQHGFHSSHCRVYHFFDRLFRKFNATAHCASVFQPRAAFSRRVNLTSLLLSTSTHVSCQAKSGLQHTSNHTNPPSWSCAARNTPSEFASEYAEAGPCFAQGTCQCAPPESGGVQEPSGHHNEQVVYRLGTWGCPICRC